MSVQGVSNGVVFSGFKLVKWALLMPAIQAVDLFGLHSSCNEGMGSRVRTVERLTSGGVASSLVYVLRPNKGVEQMNGLLKGQLDDQKIFALSQELIESNGFEAFALDILCGLESLDGIYVGKLVFNHLIKEGKAEEAYFLAQQLPEVFDGAAANFVILGNRVEVGPMASGNEMMAAKVAVMLALAGHRSAAAKLTGMLSSAPLKVAVLVEIIRELTTVSKFENGMWKEVEPNMDEAQLYLNELMKLEDTSNSSGLFAMLLSRLVVSEMLDEGSIEAMLSRITDNSYANRHDIGDLMVLFMGMNRMDLVDRLSATSDPKMKIFYDGVKSYCMPYRGQMRWAQHQYTSGCWWSIAVGTAIDPLPSNSSKAGVLGY
ncbi:MAG: hypothetical protein S4CHLAM102_00990 [Chlamydiia bacterium]|nr:hypothetical protein [Chlamydiia bacterium]